MTADRLSSPLSAAIFTDGTAKNDSLTPVDVHFAQALMTIADESHPLVARVLRLVSAAARNGNVCIRLNDRDILSQLKSESLPVQSVKDVIALLEDSRLFTRDDRMGTPSRTPLVFDDAGHVYLERFYDTQLRLVKAIVEKANLSETVVLPDEPVSRAVTVASHSAFMVVTGGPGAGKTTLVATVLASLLSQNPALRIGACAPTGKAAVRLRDAIERCRMSESLCLHFSDEVLKRLPDKVLTIHKLLSPIGAANQFRYSQERTLPLDVLVVDEASMVDVQLMTAVFEAVPKKAKVILLGDEHQLSSIEPGRVLGDICMGAQLKPPRQNSAVARGIVPLAGSFRFLEESGIGQLANAINGGDAQRAFEVGQSPEWTDVTLVDVNSEGAMDSLRQMAGSLYVDAVKGSTAKKQLCGFESARLLAAVNNGPFGVNALNRLVEKQLASMHLIFPYGDVYDHKPILIPQNDYSISLFNGDTGVLVQESGRLLACFRGDEGKIRKLPVSFLRHHLPAYATTIHKSQGSEFDHVAVVLPTEESPMLTRELLYTAVTRARKKLTIFATHDVIRHCIDHPTKRVFSLAHRLWGIDHLEES